MGVVRSYRQGARLRLADLAPVEPAKPALAPRDGLHSHPVGIQTGYTVSDPDPYADDHRGHACCLDAARADRFTLVRRHELPGEPNGTARGYGPLAGEGGGRPGRQAVVLVPARCRLNGCPCCGPLIVRRNQARAFMGLDEPDAAVVGISTFTLDPEAPAYVEYLDAKDGYVRIAGRRTKARTVRWGEETALSCRFIGAAFNRWVTYVRRYELRHVCPECRRAVGGYPRIGRHRKGCASRRLLFDGLGYFKGLELQRNGRAHLHVLVRFAELAHAEAFRQLMAPGGALHQLAIDCGFGGKRKWRTGSRLRSGVEFEVGRSKRELARYVAKVAGSKYAPGGELAAEVAKERQAHRLPPRARRATWSRGKRAWARRWRRRERQEGVRWAFVLATPERTAAHLGAAGWLTVPGRSPGRQAPTKRGAEVAA